VPSDFRLLTASSVLQPNNLKPPTKLTLMSEGAQRKRKKFFHSPKKPWKFNAREKDCGEASAL
jgi:hypothetical protein